MGLSKNLPNYYEVRKFNFPHGGFKNIFPRPLFTIIFIPKIVILDIDSILRVKTMVE
jgi:hypothetical protein